MNPGSSVASPRSMTVASAGILAPGPTAVIVPSAKTTTPGETSWFPLPSYIWAAFSTTGAPLSAAKTEDEIRENHSRQLRIGALLIEAVSQFGQSYPLWAEDRSPPWGIWIEG